MFPEIELKEEVEVKIKSTDLRNLVIYNDDVNTFDYVINLLIEVCSCTPIQAEQITYIIHYKGKCQAKKGTFKELKPLHETLSDKGLTVAIE